MIRVGLIVAPGTANNIVNKIENELVEDFKKQISAADEWEIDIIVDPLTGETEFTNQIYSKTDEYLRENDWNFLISITDLPLFYKDKAVVIDIDSSDCAAMMSIPAFGWRPLKKRMKTAIINTLVIINKMNNNDTDIEEECRELKNMFTLSKLKHTEDYFEDSKTEHLLFHMNSKIRGTVRLVSGMTFANNPYNTMQSLSGVTAIAFATGAFGIIFSTMWNLSYLFPTWRLVAISVLSIFGMLFWIIISHDLWEQFKEGESKKLTSLYNSTTLLTLFISLLFYYLLLYLLFLSAAVTLLPPDFVAKTIQAEHIGVRFYLELAWFAASLTTVAGAIGAGFQDKQVIQESTYGYRQRMRYQKNEEENGES
ncbi:MAG TPA: 5,10-methylene-tetrahydrofolate dehydrogenase [Jeotgalicoccus sp.]|nr:5,10-methylene-tetrahydrofolate dehydrogenase [Jeotgalicoccus sp.]